MEMTFEEILKDLRKGGDIEKYVTFARHEHNINTYYTINFRNKILNGMVNNIKSGIYKNNKGKKVENVKNYYHIKFGTDEVKEIMYDKLIDLMQNSLEMGYWNFVNICVKGLYNKNLITTKIENNKQGKNITYREEFLSKYNKEADDEYSAYENYYYNSALDEYSYDKYQQNDDSEVTKEYEAVQDLIENPESILRKDAKGQREIVNLLIEGLNQKQIADKLNVSETNISQQIKKIRNRLNKKYNIKETRTEIELQLLLDIIEEYIIKIDKTLKIDTGLNKKVIVESKIKIENMLNNIFQYSNVNIEELFKNKIIDKTQLDIIEVLSGDNQYKAYYTIHTIKSEYTDDSYYFLLKTMYNNLSQYIRKYNPIMEEQKQVK